MYVNNSSSLNTTLLSHKLTIVKTQGTLTKNRDLNPNLCSVFLVNPLNTLQYDYLASSF